MTRFRLAGFAQNRYPPRMGRNLPVLLLLPFTGCMTFKTTMNPRERGGQRILHFSSVREHLSGRSLLPLKPADKKQDEEAPTIVDAMVWNSLMIGVDLPLCVVADTLLFFTLHSDSPGEPTPPELPPPVNYQP